MEPVIIPRSEHPISRKSIDPDAVKVLYRLHRAGFQAYLVGGGVRDLLLGRNPKDFDISTDAHPHQVKRLFRNCRLIGRRFRLAHVHFGAKIVEVSTFRKRTEPVPDEIVGLGEEEDILIRSDNTFGNAEEDALRRDFTINGLFYDIGSFAVIDYVTGLDDLNAQTIRTIGAPGIRFREDPIRMIRAIKFAARLDFQIEPATWQAILENHDEILKSAPPRILEEIYRLLGGGAAERSFHLLEQSGMLDILVPQLTEYLESRSAENGHGAEQSVSGIPSPMSRWLAALDRLRAEDAPLTNAILIGALVGPMAFDQIGAGGNGQPAAGSSEAETRGSDDAGEFGQDGTDFELREETEDRIYDVLATLGVPRRDTERLFQTFRAMRRFTGQRNRKFSPRSFVSKNYFPETFLFLHLATEATGRSEEVLTRWRKLAEEAGLDGSIPTGTRRRRRRRRRSDDDTSPGFENNPVNEDGMELEFEPGDALETGAAEVLGVGAEPPPAPAAEPDRPRGRIRRDAEIPSAPVEVAPPQPVTPHVDEEDEEDSQIRFLGWSDQPEILRDRPEPPPLINPYTRQASGTGRRSGGFRRPEGGGPRQAGGGYSGPSRHGGSGPRHSDGGPRYGSGPRPPASGPRSQGGGPRPHEGGPRPPDGNPRQQGGSRHSGGGSGGPGGGRGGYAGGRDGFGGQGRGNPTGGAPDSGFVPPDRGGQGRGGQGGLGGRQQGGGTGPTGPPGGQSGRRPRRRQRRRED
ncbi:MAG: polynucleotide adenylyltransferase PcnB [Candidatus Eisenbacteria bacterium]|nr:polynucleotide adenylyltransferase PcnB [Candidatus Eisenbacteria bacterium]